MEDLNGVIVMALGKKVAWFNNPGQAETWASENYFGQWLITNYNISKTTNEEADLSGFIIVLEHKKIAWFENKDSAKIWAKENNIGIDLIKNETIPNKPLYTKEQLDAIYKESEKLLKKFSNPKVAD